MKTPVARVRLFPVHYGRGSFGCEISMHDSRADNVRRWLSSPPGLALLIVLLWAVFTLSRWTPCLSVSPDAAIYVELGHGLARGEGYRVHGVPCRAYPPGFPLMLRATLSPPGSGNYTAANGVGVLSALGAMLAAAWLLAQRHRGWTLALLTALVCAAPAFLLQADRMVSDVPFFFMAMLYLAAADRFWSAERLRPGLSVLAALALGAAALTRSAGVMFYPMALLWLAGRWVTGRGDRRIANEPPKSGEVVKGPPPRRRDARRCVVFGLAVLLLACPPVIGWFAWVRAHSGAGTSSYGEFVGTVVLKEQPLLSAAGMAQFVRTEAHAARVQAGHAARTLFGYRTRPRDLLLAIFVAPPLLWGLWRALRRQARPSDYAFCGYALLVLGWPALGEGTRLWFPVLPLMLSYLAGAGEGLCEAVRERGRLRHLRWLPALMGAGLLTAYMAADVKLVRDTWKGCRNAINGVVLSGDRWEVARFLREPHEKPVALACTRPMEVAVAVERPGVRLVSLPGTDEGDADAFLRALERRGVTHVALEHEPTAGPRAIAVQLARDVIHARPERFDLVGDLKRVEIYEVLPVPGQAPMDPGTMRVSPDEEPQPGAAAPHEAERP